MPATQSSFDLEFTLRRAFKKQTFRPLQREVITAALNGEDVFLQAATSFGKSICFQLPAVINSGITIVVSPLLALMSNQVTGLRESGIRVESLDSNTPLARKQEIREDLRCGHPRIKLLYVTPEHCKLDYFRNLLRIVHEQRELARIVIDEAHCISEWGHDFRPAFLGLSFFREEFPDIPIFCCTATATSQVREDVIQILKLNPGRLEVFTMTSSRPNLHFEVRYQGHEDDPFEDFTKWLKAVHKRRTARAARLGIAKKRLDNVSGIIYIHARADCESLAERLREVGIGAKPYHAKLTRALKDDHLQGWVENRVGYDIIVATTAFGMGIDKEDVRFVVHWVMPKSFEGFYQEAGRAGRDSKASACILYYSRKDRDWLRSIMGQDSPKRKNSPGAIGNAQARSKSFEALVGYCEAVGQCRHKMIAQFFGDVNPGSGSCDWACDWHKDPQKLKKDKRDALDSEEWCQTQRDMGAYPQDIEDVGLD
jgi:RecQ family ATP-dependent DNA helicase